MRGLTRHILQWLLAMLLAWVLTPGCVATPEADDASDLRLRFPEQAARVLNGVQAFTARGGGFRTDAGGDDESASRRRGGLAIALPASADDEVHFQLDGGFEVRVREIGASGPGTITERAVAYARDGGTSYWTATEQGYEEWLLLDAGRANAGAPVATWEIFGATARQDGEAVALYDDHGAARIRVTAPAAYGVGGRRVTAALTARGAKIELSVDAGGEAVLVDPLWSSVASMSTARNQHTATLLASGKVLVTGGYNGAAYLSSAELYDPSTNTWSSAGSMSTARSGHTATLLASGKVLVAGGYSGSTYLASAELYDPMTNTWSSAGSMSTARNNHAATMFVLVLASSKVLVTGGYNSSGYVSSAEAYSPATNTWSSAGSMSAARYNHAAASLGDGKVLVSGGYNSSGVLWSAEIYSPLTNTWSTAAWMNVARSNHTATVLSSGQVLVSGGYNSGSGALSSAEVYDPTFDQWSSTWSMGTARQLHTATKLENGRVLVAGGYNSSGHLASARLYDPTTNAWSSVGSMGTARRDHTATLLTSGKVLFVGGYNGSGPLSSAETGDVSDLFWSPAASMSADRVGHTATLLGSGKVLVAGGSGSANVERYDPTTNTWSSAGSMSTARYRHTATLLANGKVLVTGGYNGAAYLSNAELYDPSTNTWSSAGSMSTARYRHTATLLASGKVLVAGGTGVSWWGDPVLLASAELYDPVTNTWSGAAAMSTARSNYTATRLGDGRVLAVDWSSAEIYNPTTNTWSAAGSMNAERWLHAAVLLGNGKVLVAGGEGTSSSSAVDLSSAELYDPMTNTWSPTGSMSEARQLHTATLLGDGKVLAAGGFHYAANGYQYNLVSSAEVYDPATGTWSPVASLNTPRYLHTATMLGNGRVLAVGGIAPYPKVVPGQQTSSAELY